MEFVDLGAQQKRISDKIDASIKKVLNHGQFIMGPEVKEIENSLAAYTGVKYAVGCSSGTDALLLALLAYGAGPGDAIFTTPFTFIATAEVISLLGAVPVFIDIDSRTFNMDPEKLEEGIKSIRDCNSIQARAFKQPLVSKGIIGVDLFGLPADYQKINGIAKEYSLFVIEDGAQSLGAEYLNRKACALAEIGCTSFFPAKPLGCYGDGGMCFTENEDLATIMRSLRIHGKGTDKYDNVRIGVNGRLDTLQAAILLAKYEIFAEEIEKRREVARRYDEFLRGNDIELPFIPEGYKSAWAQYSLLFKDNDLRKSCQERLAEAGIPSAVYYPKPLHLQTAFASLGYREGDLPVSESISKRILSLPMHPYLSEEDQEKIARIISRRS
jgi:UDP-2-acetamido-2-deoxy-ribo-hexuluronate aminotransferase